MAGPGGEGRAPARAIETRDVANRNVKVAVRPVRRKIRAGIADADAPVPSRLGNVAVCLRIGPDAQQKTRALEAGACLTRFAPHVVLAGQLSLRRADRARRKDPLRLAVVMDGQADLLQIVRAIRSPRRLAGVLNCRQQQRQQDGDHYGDHKNLPARAQKRCPAAGCPLSRRQVRQ